jgi:hypothetical protein
MSRVGIIANPAAGKDIRRLVAHGSTFDNNEKINNASQVPGPLWGSRTAWRNKSRTCTVRST